MDYEIPVSVLMPAYNAEKYVGEAIESILNQTFTNFEFIIIDDGSSDRTWEIIQDYAIKDARITALKHEKNIGISGTRNQLIDLARGKYVIWQDADDISMKYRVDHQYLFMESHPAVGICGGYLQFFNERGLQGVRKYAVDDESLRRTIFRYSPVAQPAAIVRTHILKEAGKFSAELSSAEDLEVSFQIGTQYKFGNLQEVLIKYRNYTQSSTFTDIKSMELNTLKIRIRNIRNGAYRFSLIDLLYNFLQFISIYLIPPQAKISLFNKIRNSKI
jgi:glycosyltransferase involved in cell wall biosynthesis